MGNGWRIYEIYGEHLKKMPIYGEYHGVDDKIHDLLWHFYGMFNDFLDRTHGDLGNIGDNTNHNGYTGDIFVGIMGNCY